MAKNSKKIDMYEEITNKIIEGLEQGIVPWERPWTGSRYYSPTSAASGKSYGGLNNMYLSMISQMQGYKSNQWVTYNQAIKLGGKVREHEKGVRITYYKSLRITDKDAVQTDNDEISTKVIPMLKYFTVFNLDQCDGLDKLINKEFEDQTTNVIPANELAEELVASTNASISFDGGNRAFYRPATDSIHMPARESFKSERHYYATLLHELTHWTGHKSRMNRDDGYAFEELVAEIGASFLCNYVGYEYDAQHTSYIDSWLKALRSDKKFIFRASAKAQKATEHVLSYFELEEEADTPASSSDSLTEAAV